MKICYQDKKFRNASLKLIALCNEIIADWNAKGYSLTLRQLYYQLVSRAVITNDEQSYDNIGAMISDARLAGLVDWHAIIDRTRALRALSHWDTPSDIVAGSAKQFNYDRWEDQPTRVEVWVEKDALVDVIGQACNKFDVPFFSCRGYTSQSTMWGAARRIESYLETGATSVVLLHLGDHDPSGLDMTRDISDRLTMFCEGDGFAAPIVKRIALNMDQIRQYNPPPNPAKLTDCRAKGYIAEHGHESWELDALQPDVIAKLVTDHIQEFLDNKLFAAATARQEKARAELTEIASNYDTILTGQAELAKIHDALGEDRGSTVEGLADVVSELKETATQRSEQLDISEAARLVLAKDLSATAGLLNAANDALAVFNSKLEHATDECRKLKTALDKATAKKGKKKNATKKR